MFAIPSHLRKACPHLLALLLALTTTAGRAQSSAGSASIQSSQMGPSFSDSAAPSEQQDPTERRHFLRRLNAARQKSMVSDTEKLLVLARQLNSGVAPDGSAFTDDQRMRLTAEIEKLAHGIKEKMSYAASGEQPEPNPFHAWPQ